MEKRKLFFGRSLLHSTLQRPRELLQFLRRSVETALNRGHNRVTSDDFKQAAIEYSDDLLIATGYEIQATHSEYDELLYYFERAPASMTRAELEARLGDRGLQGVAVQQAIELLLEFGFLGVQSSGMEPTYSYKVQHSLERLLANTKQPGATFVIHPGFRASLKIA